MKKVRNYFFDGHNYAKNIAFFRIAVGLLLLLHFLSLQKDFSALFGSKALIPSDIQTIYIHGVLLYNDIIALLTTVVGSEPVAVLVFKVLYVILCLMIVAGFYSRIAAVLLLLLQVGLIKSAYYFSYGVDYFSSMSIFYIILYPSDQYWSVRTVFYNEPNKTVYSPFFKLHLLHLNIAYCVSGLEKISGFNWRNGEAIWKALHLPSFSNDFGVNIDLFGSIPIVLIIAGWGTIAIELLYPIFINIRKTKGLWLSLTILMHLGIAIFLNLYFFSAMMVIWNITIYYFSDQPEIPDNHVI